ncbi:hypothetical protein [Dinoroseobacter sp. S76]|uniref:hypothetical protein n=1 Tax=Dinoroseobacter sp. S76 TaxID=3415124 RepID=UPI003C79986D
MTGAGADLWQRRGVIQIAPEPGVDWWQSHAQNPTPLIFDDRHWRLYYAVRDQENRARMLWVDVDPLDEMRVIGRSDRPILPLGVPGTFDSAGQGPSVALWRDGIAHLYYMGMHLRRDVPYGLALGLATSPDGAAFTRQCAGPVLSVGSVDPFFVSLAHIQAEPTGFSAWYMSATGWTPRPEGPADADYGLRRAVSEDGLTWTPQDVLIAPGTANLPEGGGLARPWRARIDGGERLYFSYRARSDFRTDRDAAYRILSLPLDAEGLPAGPAEPLVFANPPTTSDWDGFMQAYPTILPLGQGHVMLYNGNGFGQTGFGWATRGL